MRRIFFWAHLVAGLVAGVCVAIMCFTGAVLAFETEIVAWAERDARRVLVPQNPEEARLSLADLQRRVVEARPALRTAAITVERDPSAAVTFAVGREPGIYVNPYSAEIREPASRGVREFMHVMTDWHRFLGREGESRPIGKAINGACNLAFLFLAISGLYLWWPRTWSWRSVKAIAVFNWRLAGKARDFNWHNAIGLWCSPVLIILTLTAVPISYRWGTALIYRMAGEEPPAQGGPASVGAPARSSAPPSGEAQPVNYDEILSRVGEGHPEWTQLTLRRGGPERVQRPSNPGVQDASVQSAAGEGKAARGQLPVTVVVRDSRSWPRTATTTYVVDPLTGITLGREAFGELSVARQIRSWTRFLHTGQALGGIGQLVAALASLGGLFLVYTGAALAWRRFFGRRVS